MSANFPPNTKCGEHARRQQAKEVISVRLRGTMGVKERDRDAVFGRKSILFARKSPRSYGADTPFFGII